MSSNASLMTGKDTAQSKSSRTSRRYQDSTHLIPTPGDYKKSNRFHTAFLSLPLTILTPLFLFGLGVALEVAISISNKNQGFPVPKRNVFSRLSTQFLLTFFPTLVVFPGAFLYRELDFHIRWYQPYVVLARGNAPAEESLLLDYLYEGVVLSIFHAMRWKHRLIFWSSLTAVFTYAFQPLAAGIFTLVELPQEEPIEIQSIRTIGLLNDAERSQLNAFGASAGYAEAAVFNDLSDPPFIREGWATAEFEIPSYAGFNGSIVVNTTAVQTLPKCANPADVPTITVDPESNNVTIVSRSVEGCEFLSQLNPETATQQYGVRAAPCNDSANLDLEQQPVMFWYYHTRDDTGEREARTVFCAPTLETMRVTASVDLTNMKMTSCEKNEDYRPSNNVTGPPLNSNPFNGVVFQDRSNSFVQARAIAINNGIPGAVFRFASQRPNGPQSTFDLPNGFLDLTSIVYRQHLALSAKAIYFVSENSTLDNSVLTSYVPRLVVNPLPAHGLSIILILVGIVGLIVQLGNRRQRRKLLLAAPPGTIASIVALTSRSGFGELLLPYDNEETLQKKLQGLRFRLDERTGAIVAEEAVDRDRDDMSMSLLAGHHRRPESSSVTLRATSPGLSRSSTAYSPYDPERGYPPFTEPLRTPYDRNEP